MDIRQIVDMFGGRVKMAEALGIPTQNITNWIHRDAIPADNWKAIIELAKERRKPVTLKKLFDMHYGEAA